MLELIFQGFAEWIYGLILACWEYFTSALLDIMSLDFAYLKAHIPVITDIMQVLLAVGWALLLGNLVFQAIRSMISGLGFEGEDPKLLFARTFVFSFLLLASPQICEIGLSLTSRIMDLLGAPRSVSVHFVDDSVFGELSANWILVIIVNLIIMFKVLGLILKIAEQHVVLSMLTITAPLAFAMGGSRSTSEIFSGWCRMFGSMCTLMVTNIIFFKMLFSVLSAVPSGLDTFAWMALVLAIVKVAKKADSIITRIGLNPATTGNDRGIPGLLAYAVVRSAVSGATKSVGKAIGGSRSGATAGSYSRMPVSPAGRTGRPGKSNQSTMSAGTDAGHAEKGGAGHMSQSNSVRQNISQQNTASQQTRQTAENQTTQNGQFSQKRTPAQSGAQPQAPVTSASASLSQRKQSVSGNATRKTTVPPGTPRAPSHVRMQGAGVSPEKRPGTADTGAHHVKTLANPAGRGGVMSTGKRIPGQGSPYAGQSKTVSGKSAVSAHSENSSRNTLPVSQSPGAVSEKRETRFTHQSSTAPARPQAAADRPGVQPGTAGTHESSRQLPVVSSARQSSGPAQQEHGKSTRHTVSSIEQRSFSPAQQESGRATISTRQSTGQSVSGARPGTAGIRGGQSETPTARRTHGPSSPPRTPSQKSMTPGMKSVPSASRQAAASQPGRKTASRPRNQKGRSGNG